MTPGLEQEDAGCSGDHAAGETVDASPPVGEPTCDDQLSAAELKAQGNDAYQRQELQMAVDLWNRALRRHLEDLEPGVPKPSVPGQDSKDLECSIYLNLAQGYLKLGQPDRALRACQVVALERPTDAKARYRAAEACHALHRLDEAREWLADLVKAGRAPAEAARLLQRVRAEQQAAARKEQELAKKMCTGTAGFSEHRGGAGPRTAAAGLLGHADPASVAMGTEVADAAARAALERDARRAAGPPAPAPEVHDLEAFKAKALARSQKYRAHMERSKKQREGAQRSLKLQWLRGGQDASGFTGFVSPLQDELQAMQARELEAAAAAEDPPQPAPEGQTAEEPGCQDASEQSACPMEQMD